MAKQLRTVLAVAVVVVVLAASATMALSDQNRDFRAHLNGSGVTRAVDTRAQGEAVLNLSKDGTQLSYRISVASLQNPTMAGIHVGSAMVACLYMPAQPPQGRVDGVLAQGVITAADLTGPLAGKSLQDLASEIAAGNAVVHVCTAQNMPEIAGQLH